MATSIKREAIQEESQKRLKKEEDEANSNDLSTGIALDTEGKRRRGKRHKYVMLLSYSGRNYFGMQIQNRAAFPTIEQQIFDVLLKLRFINGEERTNPKGFWFQRAARTDKGVSAVGQVCSLILPLREDKEVQSEGEEDVSYTPATLVDAMNLLLPEDIRVIALKRATKSFDSKNACQARTYAYMLPSYAFARKNEDMKDFRISDERLAEVNELLWTYQGTHNFFNFTCRRTSTDVSCSRYIMRCKCDRPLVRDNIEFLTVHLKGQSFMFHQIRKMIGLCIAIIRGLADKTVMEKAWIPVRFDVPIAPSLGLALEEVHYDFYNQKYERTHEPLDWSLYKEKIDGFRERYIDSVVVETEIKEQTMLRWLSTLECHNFDSTAVNSSAASQLREDSDEEADRGYTSD